MLTKEDLIEYDILSEKKVLIYNSFTSEFGPYFGSFRADLNPSYRNVLFLCPYHFYLSEMALFFKDIKTLKMLLALSSFIEKPYEVNAATIYKVLKKLELGLSGFSYSEWFSERKMSMKRAMTLKYTLNKDLFKRLFEHRGKVLISINIDPIWGAAKSNNRIWGTKEEKMGLLEPKKWTGENWEGFILMEVIKDIYFKENGGKRSQYRGEWTRAKGRWDVPGGFRLKEK